MGIEDRSESYVVPMRFISVQISQLVVCSNQDLRNGYISPHVTPRMFAPAAVAEESSAPHRSGEEFGELDHATGLADGRTACHDEGDLSSEAGSLSNTGSAEIPSPTGYDDSGSHDGRGVMQLDELLIDPDEADRAVVMSFRGIKPSELLRCQFKIESYDELMAKILVKMRGAGNPHEVKRIGEVVLDMMPFISAKIRHGMESLIQSQSRKIQEWVWNAPENNRPQVADLLI